MGTKNKKIEKYQNEIRKTREKIADLQQHLKSLLAMLKKEEDLEMVRSFRSRGIDGDSLYDLLNGIQDGSIQFYKNGKPVDTTSKETTKPEIQEEPVKENDHGKAEKND